MKRNLDQPILQLDGTPFADSPTLKVVVFMAVTTPIPEDQQESVDIKLKRYGLAQKVHAGGEVDLTAEEITLIKARIARLVSSVIAMGRAFELLEDTHAN